MQPYVVPAPIPHWRGDYFSGAFRLRSRVWNQVLNNGAGGWEPGPYTDLTGYTGIFQVRLTEDQTTIDATGTVTVLDQVALCGAVRYSLEGPDTQALAGLYFFDVQMTDTAGKPRTIIAGQIDFHRDVSRV